MKNIKLKNYTSEKVLVTEGEETFVQETFTTDEGVIVVKKTPYDANVIGVARLELVEIRREIESLNKDITALKTHLDEYRDRRGELIAERDKLKAIIDPDSQDEPQ